MSAVGREQDLRDRSNPGAAGHFHEAIGTASHWLITGF
jgi:hypothetical protein